MNHKHSKTALERMRKFVKSLVKETMVDAAPQNDCEFWGENRADELWIDVGCVLGIAFCDPSTCKHYQPTGET